MSKRNGNKPGPKPKITEDDRRQVLAALGVGGTIADAAGLIKVNVSTLRRLKAKDTEFARGVRHAVKAGKLKLIQRVANAPAWQAAAWMLERKYGAEYGRKDRHEHTGPNSGPIATEHTEKHLVDYDAIEAELGKIAGRMAARAPSNGRGEPVHTG